MGKKKKIITYILLFVVITVAIIITFPKYGKREVVLLRSAMDYEYNETKDGWSVNITGVVANDLLKDCVYVKVIFGIYSVERDYRIGTVEAHIDYLCHQELWNFSAKSSKLLDSEPEKHELIKNVYW